MYSLNIPFTMKKMATQFWLEFVMKREDIGIQIFKIMQVDYFQNVVAKGDIGLLSLEP